MSSAVAVQPLTPADIEIRLDGLGIPVVRPLSPSHTVAGIEHCLSLDGIPLDRFLNHAKVPRSTWLGWRAGRARPRPDRWAVVTAAFDALVVEAAPAAAPAESAGADVVPLTGSSPPTGAPPRFVPIATATAAACPDAPTPAAPAAPLDRDAAVIAAADRAAALARREWASIGMSMRTDERRGSHPGPRTEAADRAANRLCRRLNRRLRSSCRALARRPATTPAALAAKARAALAVRNATASDRWWTALRDAVLRDAARLDRAGGAAAPAGLAALTAEWLRTGSIDGRDRDALAAMPPRALGAPDALDVFRANAREHVAVLCRIAALRSTAPDVLALKAAAVLAGCRDAAGLDAEIARDGGADINTGDLSVALSLARDVAALFPDRVAPLVAAVNAAQDLPTIDRRAPDAAAAA